MKCVVKMGDKVSPVEGSSDGETGTCPTCKTPGVVLSVVGGYIRAHTVADREIPENNPKPATLTEKPVKYGKGLTEPMVDLTDTGLRTGDPRIAEQRRVVDIEGANGLGTVKVPRKVQGTGVTKSGKPRMVTKLIDVPATEENTREALDYWRKKKPQSDTGRKAQNDNVSALVRRLEAMRKGAEVLAADMADSASVHRGPTLVPGRDTAPRLRDPEKPWTEPTDLRRDGRVRLSTTLDQPRGRDRFDRKITDVPEPAPKRTPSQRRAYRRKMAAKMARQSNKG